MAENVDPIIAEAAAKLKRLAYEAGWRDAIAALNKAVTELPDPSTWASIPIYP